VSVRRFTNSELSEWRDCRRRWWFKHYRKLGPREKHINENQEIGNIYHEAIAHGYETNWAIDVEAVVAYLVFVLEEKHTCEICEPKIKKVREYSEKMVTGYVEWLAEEGVDQDLILLSTEEEITAPSGLEDINLLGKIDARFQRESDGFIFFMDHKSVQNLTDRPKWAHLDTQFKFYALLEKLTKTDGTYTDGGIINMARRVKRSATAKPPFYGRFEVRHSDEELRQFWWSTHHTIRDILEAERKIIENQGMTNHLYPSPSQDCTWKCEFFNACPMVDKGEDLEDYLQAAYIEIDPLERYSS